MKLLKTGSLSAFENMGIDEALMKTCQTPVLRLYGWTPCAVSIGYFQGLEEEVDLGVAKAQGVDVVRRITGGGAVFHDKELTYSFVTRDFQENILDSYKEICGAVLLGLKTIGVEGQFAPLNDLVVNGKKFSGNAQTRKGGVLLQHGTILLDVDVDKMFSLLKVPSEKMRDKIVSDVKARVTGIDRTFDEVAVSLEFGFSHYYNNIVLEPVTLSDEQKEISKEATARYASSDWLRLR